MFNATAPRSNVSAVGAHANTSQLPAQADTTEPLASALDLLTPLFHGSLSNKSQRWALNRDSLANYLSVVLGLPYDKGPVNPIFKRYAKEFNPPLPAKTLPETLPHNASLLAVYLILSVYPEKAFANSRLNRDFFFAALEHHTGQSQDALRRSIQAEDLDSIEIHSVASDGAIEVTFLPGLHIPFPPPSTDAEPLESDITGSHAPENIAQHQSITSPSTQPQPNRESWALAWQNDDASQFAQFLDTAPHIAPPPTDGQTLLHDASALARPNILNLLLKQGMFDVNTQRADGRTPLHLACASGNVAAIDRLLNANANSNAQDANRMTPLMLACQHQHADVVKVLLQQTTLNIHLVDKTKWSALHWAAHAGNEKIIRALLAKGADPLVREAGHPSPLSIAKRADQQKAAHCLQQHVNDLLADAATRGVTVAYVLQELQFSGALIDSVNNAQHTPLYTAIAHGNFASASALARIYAAEGGYTALTKAIQLYRHDHPTDTSRSESTALIKACASQSLAPVIGLLAKGVSLTTQAVWKALESRNREVLELLLHISPAFASARDASGITPLHYAAGRDDYEMIEILLRHKVDINVRSEIGETALHYAVAQDNRTAVELLLARHIELDAQSVTGSTALHYAVKRGAREMVAFLLNQNANPLAQTRSGETALHFAARNGDIVKSETLLKKCPALLHIRNNAGELPINYALNRTTEKYFREAARTENDSALAPATTTTVETTAATTTTVSASVTPTASKRKSWLFFRKSKSIN